jgi:hypothetical protein
MEPVAFETFGEELTTAQDDVAAEAARDHQELYDPRRRQADRSRGADIRFGHVRKPFRIADTDQCFRMPGPQ